MKYCPYCQTPIDYTISRSTVCSSCNKELHTCSACKFYSPGSHYDCLEDVDELVVDKNRANFCDSFSLTDKKIKTEDKKKADRAKLDALFNF